LYLCFLGKKFAITALVYEAFIDGHGTSGSQTAARSTKHRKTPADGKSQSNGRFTLLLLLLLPHGEGV